MGIRVCKGNEFTYKGFRFLPYGKLTGIDATFRAISRRIKSDQTELRMSVYELWEGRRSWSYEDFYVTSGSWDTDLFLCLDNQKNYIPGQNELFLYEDSTG